MKIYVTLLIHQKLRVSNPLKRHDIVEMSILRPSNLIKFIQALIGSILVALKRMTTLPGVRNYVLITFDTSLDNVYSKRNELGLPLLLE